MHINAKSGTCLRWQTRAKKTRDQIASPAGVSYAAAPYRRMAAFTIIELMVVIAIVAIATMVAVPDFTSWIMNAHIEEAAGHLQEDLQWARGYALKSGQDVSVQINQVPSPVAGGGTVCMWSMTNTTQGTVIAGAPVMTPKTFSEQYPNIACRTVMGTNPVQDPITMTPQGFIVYYQGAASTQTMTNGTIILADNTNPSRFSTWLVQYYGAGELRSCAAATGPNSLMCALS